MKHQGVFRQNLREGRLSLGTCITFSDPAISEALANVLDFVWIDTEHNPISLEAVQSHLLAVKGTNATPLVRVPWNDPVLIKPVLDIGAAGVIVPLIRTADDARRAVSACLYPPQGVRGYGPRRPSNYGIDGGPDFCRRANESLIVIVQIEHEEAVRNIDEIVAVPGLASLVIGPNDLAGSLGHIGEPRHPSALAAIDVVLEAARKVALPVGLAVADDAGILGGWIDKGASWLSMGADYSLILRAARELVERLRKRDRNEKQG